MEPASLRSWIQDPALDSVWAWQQQLANVSNARLLAAAPTIATLDFVRTLFAAGFRDYEVAVIVREAAIALQQRGLPLPAGADQDNGIDLPRLVRTPHSQLLQSYDGLFGHVHDTPHRRVTPSASRSQPCWIPALARGTGPAQTHHWQLPDGSVLEETRDGLLRLWLEPAMLSRKLPVLRRRLWEIEQVYDDLRVQWFCPVERDGAEQLYDDYGRWLGCGCVSTRDRDPWEHGEACASLPVPEESYLRDVIVQTTDSPYAILFDAHAVALAATPMDPDDPMAHFVNALRAVICDWQRSTFLDEVAAQLRDACLATEHAWTQFYPPDKGARRW